MHASSLPLPVTRSPLDRSSLFSPVKRLCSQALISAGEAVPPLRPALARWGLRTWKYWTPDVARHVYTPEGKVFEIAGNNYLSFELFWKGTGYYEPISTLL